MVRFCDPLATRMRAPGWPGFGRTNARNLRRGHRIVNGAAQQILQQSGLDALRHEAQWPLLEAVGRSTVKLPSESTRPVASSVERGAVPVGPWYTRTYARATACPDASLTVPETVRAAENCRSGSRSLPPVTASGPRAELGAWSVGGGA